MFLPRKNARSLALLMLTFAGCAQDPAPPPEQPSAGIAAEANYVGGRQCAACHTEEAERWRGSHHDLAMEIAGPDSVLGDFEGAQLTYNNITSEFFSRDGAYWARTDGPDGELAEFKITHTFGVTPLQQYLVQLADGRHQALSMAWDSRPADQGGQRWFHLYPDEAVDSTDPLHWTGTFQSWNTTCAECHSTDLRKNYSAEEDNFATSYASVDVDCEACHGPGSLHVQAPEESALGLARDGDARWVFTAGTTIAQRQPALTDHEEIETCAQCHSRRSQFTDAFQPGDPLLDGFRPALLDARLYHADGQILDEVYVYGSFLQSRMHQAGVSCSDCHDPHSAQLRFEGNALCGQCHLASAYDVPEHHHHERETAGSACVDCHMPATTYMVVDPRRDHSFRIPRPDLSEDLGTPNACTGCHEGETPTWAAEFVAEWFPDGRADTFHYGEALHGARTWTADRGRLLVGLLADPEIPAIVRATAVSLLAAQLDDAALGAIEEILQGDETLIQLPALEALARIPPEARIDLAQRFLTHSLRALRIAAASVLLPARPQLSERRRDDLDAALEEYWAAQRFNADRAEGLMNTGAMLVQLGELADAQTTFETALEREPVFTAAYINLADLYRAAGREADAEILLRSAIENNTQDPSGHFALGLSLVRSDRLAEAVEELDRAALLAPNEPYYQYVIGVALNSTGRREDALQKLREVHERFPGHRETLLALATIHRDGAEFQDAGIYARRLLEISPADGAARALLLELQQLAP